MNIMLMMGQAGRRFRVKPRSRSTPDQEYVALGDYLDSYHEPLERQLTCLKMLMESDTALRWPMSDGWLCTHSGVRRSACLLKNVDHIARIMNLRFQKFLVRRFYNYGKPTDYRLSCLPYQRQATGDADVRWKFLFHDWRTNMKSNMIALFDLDGTLVDYDGQLLQDLRRLASEYEPPPVLYADIPYLEARRHVITSQVGWWLKLEKFQLGWDVLDIAKEIGYLIVVLTKGPSSKHTAWAEKVEWCNQHLADYMDGVTITHDKGLVYGAVLVDDWPEYITKWLAHRPRGLVIMPAHDHNAGFTHPNVVRYDGANIDEVRTRMTTRFKS